MRHSEKLAVAKHVWCANLGKILYRFARRLGSPNLIEEKVATKLDRRYGYYCNQ